MYSFLWLLIPPKLTNWAALDVSVLACGKKTRDIKARERVPVNEMNGCNGVNVCDHENTGGSHKVTLVEEYFAI